jgi:hypothetical protein
MSLLRLMDRFRDPGARCFMEERPRCPQRVWRHLETKAAIRLKRRAARSPVDEMDFFLRDDSAEWTILRQAFRAAATPTTSTMKRLARRRAQALSSGRHCPEDRESPPAWVSGDPTAHAGHRAIPSHTGKARRGRGRRPREAPAAPRCPRRGSLSGHLRQDGAVQQGPRGEHDQIRAHGPRKFPCERSTQTHMTASRRGL